MVGYDLLAFDHRLSGFSAFVTGVLVVASGIGFYLSKRWVQPVLSAAILLGTISLIYFNL